MLTNKKLKKFDAADDTTGKKTKPYLYEAL